MLLRMERSGGRLHYHSSDYHLAVIEGEMKHWARGEQEADAPVLGPGSYSFQPGGEAHADSCLADQCLRSSSGGGAATACWRRSLALGERPERTSMKPPLELEHGPGMLSLQAAD